jgi:hypothetical protein
MEHVRPRHRPLAEIDIALVAGICGVCDLIRGNEGFVYQFRFGKPKPEELSSQKIQRGKKHGPDIRERGF